MCSNAILSGKPIHNLYHSPGSIRYARCHMRPCRARFLQFIHILVTDVTWIGPKDIDSLIKGPLLFTSFTNVKNILIDSLLLFSEP